ncbi:MAG: hypothetical protein ACE5NN_01860 [Candidatus Bathyarchaeia archaeon]
MSMEEKLTARITADVSEAVEGFRKVKSESRDLQASIGRLSYSFSGLMSSAMALYHGYERIRKAQADANTTAEELNALYVQMGLTTVPAVISMIHNSIRLYTALKAVVTSATVVQWLYNKALVATHALSGPAGWAILGIAAAVTAGAVAWASMNRQQQEYNRTLEETTREFRSLGSELAAMSPIERLQRQYQVVKEYYGYTVSVGTINVSAANLGSPYDRERSAEDLAKKIGHKLALRVINR